jgi:hypothetical protein
MIKASALLQVFVFTVFLSITASAAFLAPNEESKMLSEVWKLPSQFTQKRLESLLNQFSKATHGEAFQFIGVEEDFFHGHILFEKKLQDGRTLLAPRAVLYHTQEEAHKAHWEKSVDPKYDYLNVTTRNWIQWLSDDPSEDGRKIENARDYLDHTQKDPTQFFDEASGPQKELHYTIHAKNLDAKKLGFVLAGELQFEFYSNAQPSLYGEDHQLTVQIADEAVSLRAFTNTMYLERGSK